MYNDDGDDWALFRYEENGWEFAWGDTTAPFPLEPKYKPGQAVYWKPDLNKTFMSLIRFVECMALYQQDGNHWEYHITHKIGDNGEPVGESAIVCGID